MTELLNDEKLLTGTESEKFLPPLSAKEFLARTPDHELANIFGGKLEQPILKKEPLPPPVQNQKPRQTVFQFLTSILIFILLIITALYIYGAYLAL